MNRLIFIYVLAVAGWAFAQNCIIQAPATPPLPRRLVVELPLDGGTAGCVAYAVLDQRDRGQTPNSYSINNAKCAQVVAVAKQAAANDNGWNDGGVP